MMDEVEVLFKEVKIEEVGLQVGAKEGGREGGRDRIR